MFKGVFFHGVAAAILSTVIAIIYKIHIYFYATEADFSQDNQLWQHDWPEFYSVSFSCIYLLWLGKMA